MKTVSNTETNIDCEMTKEEFSDCLQIMREDLGVSQIRVAEYLELNSAVYGLYESGKRFPKGSWEKIYKKMSAWVAEKSKTRIKEEDHYHLIQPSVQDEIIKLHQAEKNTVQIGIAVNVEEFKVEEFLIEKGFSPNYYRVSQIGLV